MSIKTSFYTLLLFLFTNSAWAVSMPSFRYEGRLQGGSITTGTMSGQTVSVSIKRPDGCGGNLGLSAWSSSSVTFEDGAFSISPSFDQNQLASAMNPWNNFGSACSVPEFGRVMEISWSGETFAIKLEDSPRANLANFAVNASNATAIGSVAVNPALSCGTGTVLKYSTGTSRFECQVLAIGDIPALSSAQIPNPAGDISGTFSSISVDKIKGTSISSTGPTTGQVLKYDGTNWAPDTDLTGGATADATYSSKGIVQIDTDQTTSGISLATGVIKLADTPVSPGTFGDATNTVTISVDQKGRIQALSQNPVNDGTKLPLAGGTMTGPVDMGSQNITNATSVAATNFSGRNLLLNDNDTNKITIKSPINITADYTLTLPIDDGNTGQILSTDGSGVLSWVTPGGGGVAPIANGGTNSGAALSNNRMMISSANSIVEGPALADGQIVVGKTSSAPQFVSMNGDVTINNAGTTAVERINGTIVTGVGHAIDNVLKASTALGTNNLLISDLGSGITSVPPMMNGVLTSTSFSPSWTAVLPETLGGTGQASYNTGDILFASSPSNLSKLPAGGSGQVLTSNGTNTAPSWQFGPTVAGTVGFIPKFNGTASVNDSIISQSSNTITVSGNLALPSTTGSNGQFKINNTTFLHAAGNGSIFVGENSGNPGTTSSYSSGFGFQTLLNSTGTYNTAIGAIALNSNTTGNQNSAVGAQTLYSNTNGSFNTAFGKSALQNLNNGNSNVAIGYRAGYLLSSGSNNVIIGGFDGNLINGQSNIISLSDGAGTERIRIDNIGRVGIGTTIPTEMLHVLGNLRVQGLTDCTLGTGSGGTNCTSDIRLKENIRNIENPIEKILSLRGVEFDWNNKSQSPGQHAIGVIAQDVEKVFPTSVMEDQSTGYKKVDYAVLVAPLIEAFKNLHSQFELLFNASEIHEREIASIKAVAEAEKLIRDQEIADLKQRLSQLEQRLGPDPK
jgi:trimeric autotransporter adhesin